MFLDNLPDEVPRLKRYERLFEWVTWGAVITAYLLSWLPLGVPIHRVGVNLVILVAVFAAIFFYRILPFEKREGLLRFTFKFKAWIIGLANPLMISAYVLFTGGQESPFWYIYLFSPLTAALYLPIWAIFVVSTVAMATYFTTVLLVSPLFFGVGGLDFHYGLLVPPVLTLFFALALAYNQARELNLESENNKRLAGQLEKRAEVIMGERNQLNSVLFSILDGVFVLDREERIIIFNKAMEKLTNFSREKAIGKPADEIVRFFDKDHQITSQDYCKLTERERDETIFAKKKLKLLNKFENIRYVDVNSATIKEAKAINVGCIVTAHDVTEERQLEEMRLDFVSIAAHELRTPITAIRGYLSILIEEVAGKLAPEERSWLEKAFVSTSNLSSLVENLLAVSRIELRTLKLELTKCNWREILQGVVNDFKQPATQKGIHLQLKVAGGLPKIAVDRFRISEVVANLLSNAITHTKSGGRVEVSTQLKDSQIVTTVSDTGQGIPKEALSHLFTKFFRVSGVLEEGSKGTGLGLYISKAVVEMHKGKIWVESTLGVGSKFSFSLPVRAVPEESKPALLAKEGV